MNCATTQNHSPVVAVDGGGTHCRVAVRQAGGDTVVEVGSANVTTDFEATIKEVRHGLGLLATKTEMSLKALSALPAYVGLAGVAGEDLARQVGNALPFAHVRVEDDRPSALRGALGARDGVVAHCGTGSFIAAQVGGVPRFAGGWGPVLGDPASAQWVGRRALSVTLDVVDGIKQHSDLSRFFLEKFDGAAGIVAFGAKARPSDFGALAPQVTRRAVDGDALALSVMHEAGHAISEVLPVLGWLPGMAICLTGGIAPHFAPYLPKDMQAGIVDPLGEPLSGALCLAREFSEEIADERL